MSANPRPRGRPKDPDNYLPKPVGRPKGRPKGSIDRRSLTASELFAELGYDPLREMQKLSKDSKDDAIRVRCHAECAKYHRPQLRSIEMSGKMELGLSGKTTAELTAILINLVSKIGANKQ